VKQVLHEYDVDCPVVFPGKQALFTGPRTFERDEYIDALTASQAAEWGIRGIPASFLVNPQGVIVAKHLRGKAVQATLDFCLNNSDATPLAGVRVSAHTSGGGNPAEMSDGQPMTHHRFELDVELYSPLRRELTIQLNYSLVSATRMEYEGVEILTKRRFTKPDPDGPEEEIQVQFRESCEAIASFTIDANGYDGVQYSIRILLPGSGSYCDGEGIWTKQIGNYYFDFPSYTYESS
jgi:hypothetical protein